METTLWLRMRSSRGTFLLQSRSLERSSPMLAIVNSAMMLVRLGLRLAWSGS